MSETSNKHSSESGPGDGSLPPAALAAIARARRLMIIAGLTSAVAFAAVMGLIGYRVFKGRENAGGAIVSGTAFLPKGAQVTSAEVAEGRLVVTVNIGGKSEIRIFDLNTLRQIGELRFATKR